MPCGTSAWRFCRSARTVQIRVQSWMRLPDMHSPPRQTSRIRTRHHGGSGVIGGFATEADPTGPGGRQAVQTGPSDWTRPFKAVGVVDSPPADRKWTSSPSAAACGFVRSGPKRVSDRLDQFSRTAKILRACELKPPNLQSLAGSSAHLPPINHPYVQTETPQSWSESRSRSEPGLRPPRCWVPPRSG